MNSNEIIKDNINKYQNIENLVFEGGGIKAISFLGCIRYLNEKNIIPNIKKVIGSSAGCIYAVGIASKTDCKIMEDIIYKKNFLSLKDDSWGYFIDFIRILQCYGMCKGDALMSWYSEILLKITGKENITFQQLYLKTGIELVITGTNLNKMETEYFSYKQTPDMEIRLAMRISTSIPLYFKAIELNGDIYVDGGFLNNYPLNYFDEIYNSPKKNNVNKTLGLKLMSYDEKINNGTIEITRKNILNIKDYTETLINSALTQIERGYIEKNDWERSIIINTGKIEATDFNINKQNIDWLINQGYNSF